MAIISLTEITNAPRNVGNKIFCEIINYFPKYQSIYLNFRFLSALQWSVLVTVKCYGKKTTLSFQIGVAERVFGKSGNLRKFRILAH
jgi:hypothetical protein